MSFLKLKKFFCQPTFQDCTAVIINNFSFRIAWKQRSTTK